MPLVSSTAAAAASAATALAGPSKVKFLNSDPLESDPESELIFSLICPQQVRLPDLGEQESIFEQLRKGKINMKQAGNMLGIDTSMLAYQLAGKVALTKNALGPTG